MGIWDLKIKNSYHALFGVKSHFHLKGNLHSFVLTNPNCFAPDDIVASVDSWNDVLTFKFSTFIIKQINLCGVIKAEKIDGDYPVKGHLVKLASVISE